MFFTSTFVPYSSEPLGRMEMLASHRKLPCSMSAVDTPMYRRMERIFIRYWRASSGVRRSGSPTTSINGTPARFTSIRAYPSPAPSRACWSLATSSSRWARVTPTFRWWPSRSMFIQPL